MKNLYKVILTLGVLLFAADIYAQNTTCGATSRWVSTVARFQRVETTNGLANFVNTNSAYGTVQDYTQTHTVQVTKGGSFNVTVASSWYNGIWIDWDANGTYNTSNERIARWYCGSGNCTRTYTINVPSNARGKYRMRVLASGTGQVNVPCGQVNYLDGEDYTIDVLAYNNSAKIEEVISPSNPLCSSVSQVEVRLKNVGLQDLTTLDVGGEVKSVQFGTIPLTTANWTGTIPALQADTNTYVPFSYSAGFQVGDTLIVWTANPNGVTDTLSDDDTLTIVMGTGVSGTYTIGDTTAGASDFASIADAVSFIDSIGAVCGPTYFHLSDTIVWNEQMELSPLIGMSSTAFVQFMTNPSASGKATITHDHNGPGDNYTVRFGTGSHHYKFENLNIESGANSGSYRTVVYTGENSYENTVSNCNLVARVTGNTTSYYAAIISNRAQGNITRGSHDNMFENNLIENGSMAIYMWESGETNIYDGNDIRNPYYMGAYCYESQGPKFRNNTMMSNSIYTNGYGFYIYYSDKEPFEISNNTIHPERDEWPRYAIRTFSSTARANDRNMINNNSISVGQAWSGLTMYAIYMDQTGFTDITNNSIAVRGTNFDTYGLWLQSAGAMRVHNNSVANFGSGVAARYFGNSTVISSENNNLYSTGFILASYNGFGYTDLGSWQAGAGYDASSVSVDPIYYEVGSSVNGLSDLHACNVALDGAADPSFTSVFDLDSDPRDASNPDIGVDEFVGLSTLTLGADMKFCPGDSVTLETPGDLTGNTITWNTGSTDEAITVSTPGTYSFTLRNTCGSAQDTIEISYPDVVDINTPDTLICEGDMIMIAGNLMNATYTWSNGETSMNVMIDDEGEYIVDAVDQYGCPSSDTIDVSISESAQLNLSASDTVLCPGQFLSLESGVDPRTGVSYSWDGFIDGSIKTTNNVLLGWNEADNLIIEVNDNGCMSYDTLMIDNSPAAVATFTSNQVDGQTFTFSPDSMHPRFQYMWDFGDRTTSTQSTPTKLYQVQGNYTVVLTVTTLCGDATEQSDVGTQAIGMSEEIANKLVKVYPNPSSGMLNLQLEDSENVSFEVNDMNGKIVFAKEVGTVLGTSTEQIDLTGLAKGIYSVRVNLNEGTVIKKVTIE